MANLIELSEHYILKLSKSLPNGDKPKVAPLASGLHHWACKTCDFSKSRPNLDWRDSSPISNTPGDSYFDLLD